MVYKILVVEDTPENLEMYEIMLEQKGFSVLKAENGETAIKLVKNEKPDLIMLDKMLPGISGPEVCRSIKNDPDLGHIPIIIITAKDDSSNDMATDFELGADDYLKKPFESEVLFAHIDKFIKGIDYKKDGIDNTVKNGDLTLDIDRREVTAKEKKILLTRKEFDVLYLLVRRSGQIIHKEDIANIVWGYNFPEIYRAIESHIINLKRKLGKEVAKRIITASNLGYKFG